MRIVINQEHLLAALLEYFRAHHQPPLHRARVAKQEIRHEPHKAFILVILMMAVK